MGDINSKKKINLSPTTIMMISILKSLGINQDAEIPEKYSNIEDNGKSPDDLSEERKSVETEVWLTIYGIEDHDENVDILRAPQLFGERVHKASCFSSNM